MTGLVVALSAEARPLINALGLKKQNVPHRFETFLSADSVLIVSGMGRMRAAIATSVLLQQYNPANVVNVGIAGSNRRDRKVGEAFLINKITDAGLGHSFYPDCIINFSLPEAAVTTFDHVVDENKALPLSVDLVDMECSGFFESAAFFIGSHRIQAVKIVSDHLNVTNITTDFIGDLVSGKTSEVLALMERLPQAENPMFDEVEIALMNHIAGILRLTASQRHELGKSVRNAKIRGKAIKEILQNCGVQTPKSKEDGKKHFEQLRGKLG